MPALTPLIPRPPRQSVCIAKTKAGCRCKHFAVKGLPVCWVHSGQKPR